MSHTFGTGSQVINFSGLNPVSGNFTTNTGDTVLVCLLACEGNNHGGTPTFNSVALTQAGTTQKASAAPEGSAELWYLLNPPIGTFSLSIPNAGGGTITADVATGRSSTSVSYFDSTAGDNNTSTNPTVTISPVGNGTIIFSIVFSGAQTWAPSAQDGTIINNQDKGNTGYGTQYKLQAAAAPQAMGWTFATSEDWGTVVAAFKSNNAGLLNLL